MGLEKWAQGVPKQVLDKKELLKDVPLMARPIAGSLIDWLNTADVNKDGKADLAQLAAVAIKVMPIITALAPLVDWEKALTLLLEHCTKDQQNAERLVNQAIDLVSKALPKKEENV